MKSGQQGRFRLCSRFRPTGDQPQAIAKLVAGIGKHHCQTLLGVTGSGKTFTMANVIATLDRPAIVLAHNKTLAAQLYAELKEFFPHNAVEYFVSYFDYYQPESYMPQTDTYIEKDSKINPKIEQMRLSAVTSLLTRRDVIIVASVSCIYGIGSKEHYEDMGFQLKAGDAIGKKAIMRKLIGAQYERNETELFPGDFRVKGDVIDIALGYSDDIIRIELFGDEIEAIKVLAPVTYQQKETLDSVNVFPAKHFVMPESTKQKAIDSITQELGSWLPNLDELEAHRLKQRTNYDLEMLQEVGYCSGIENYSRHLDGRQAGQPPTCLLDFFPDDFIMFIDESHVTIPQVVGMYKGDRSRKKSLIDFGFRLPSAYDNRPLTFEEFRRFMSNVIFVSATPADFELRESGSIAEQIIRPTGLLDPTIEVRDKGMQVQDLIEEIRKTTSAGNRTLVTTMTKRLAEELCEYLASQKIKVRYLHSEIDTLERSEIIRQLRAGQFDCLVGINLLREGLDIPEVGLVGILDSDKEGFLRNSRSLIQTIGRAARNSCSKVIMYTTKDRTTGELVLTGSMKEAIDETYRRRRIQMSYNNEHGIKPQTILKPVPDKIVDIKDMRSVSHIPKADIPNTLIELEARMRKAAEELRFEEAIKLRDTISRLQEKLSD